MPLLTPWIGSIHKIDFIVRSLRGLSRSDFALWITDACLG